MESIQEYFENMDVVDLLLLTCIILFISLIFLFICLIVVHRHKKKRKQLLHKKQAGHIEKTLFSIAFDDLSLADLQQDPFFRRRWKKKAYRDQFLEDMIKLHRLYGGDIAQRLQKFYRVTGLAVLSLAKVRNGEWHVKCEGLQELGEMEITEVTPLILEYARSGNDTVKMVAIIELLHLKGLQGILLLKDHEEPVNDWIQLNLLESIKEANGSEVPEFGFLLESSNQSLVIFGLRLVALFHQTAYLDKVRSLSATPVRPVRIQATKTLQKLVLAG